ncbi:ABC1-domain-containing protein [Mycena polygramma]|nr:ABC1-domain-containing protein [Mycena polygramma]
MPPGPVFNWLCVASSACDIIVRVARVRAAQVASSESLLANGLKCVAKSQHKTQGLESNQENSGDVSGAPSRTMPAGVDAANAAEPHNTRYCGMDDGWSRSAPISLVQPDDAPAANESPAGQATLQNHPFDGRDEPPLHERLTFASVKIQKDRDVAEAPRERVPLKPLDMPVSPLDEKPSFAAVEAKEDVAELEASSPDLDLPSEPLDLPASTRQLQSSKVPSSRIGRLFHYGGLAASLGYGAASEIIRRTASSSGPDDPPQSVMMTEANITRLVSKLSQMRGAALKLGQFLSIQDTHVLPADVDKIFRRVQDSAHYMPDWQMEQVLTTSLGSDYAHLFTSFDRVPFAAASIGQVHTATLTADVSPTGAPARVAVKIQFPNIASSIASDLGYISLLLTAGRLLPKGLFLDRTMEVMKQELADECDYAREAGFLRAFGAPECLGGDARFKVPWVWEGSTERVLVMEHVGGTSVGEATIGRLDQRDRDEIAARIIELCLKELFEFRMMQTDPNWSNFLWNARTRVVELVDFGATRAYEKAFMDGWLRLLQAAAAEDRAACVQWSLELGYLTGEESQVMLDAHVDSMTLLATPFKPGTQQPFGFGPRSQWADITAQIRAQIPVMLQHRLTPPPQETYSLNRKLSGAFLLASRLGATVDTRAIWEKVVSKYEFGP